MLTREMMNEAWKDLVDWYLLRCRYWQGMLRVWHSVEDLRKRVEIMDMAYGLWGHVWHEHDLVLAFAYRLMKCIESKGLGIHLHVLYKLKPENFRVFKDFSKNLYEAIKSTRTVLGLGRGWYPEVDLIIAKDEPPFLFCLEFKYFHYLPTTWNVVEDLKRKVVTLRTLKRHGVCIDAGVLFLDDSLCRRDSARCEEILNLLKEASNELLVLSHHVTYDELLSVLQKLTRENS